MNEDEPPAGKDWKTSYTKEDFENTAESGYCAYIALAQVNDCNESENVKAHPLKDHNDIESKNFILKNLVKFKSHIDKLENYEAFQEWIQNEKSQITDEITDQVRLLHLTNISGICKNEWVCIKCQIDYLSVPKERFVRATPLSPEKWPYDALLMYAGYVMKLTFNMWSEVVKKNGECEYYSGNMQLMFSLCEGSLVDTTVNSEQSLEKGILDVPNVCYTGKNDSGHFFLTTWNKEQKRIISPLV